MHTTITTPKGLHMGLTYFAADGSYGDAEGLQIIDTSDWAEDDWMMIDLAPDADRPAIAASFKTNLDQLTLDLGVGF